MITIERELSVKADQALTALLPLERAVFFDIETTGLTVQRASLYLIGAVYYEAGAWRLLQWFAEGREEEASLLTAFFDFMKKKRKQSGAPHLFLLHYNGNTFDLPFIRRCAAQYYLPCELTDIVSIDLFQKIKPYKKLLGLADCKLKTVETRFGLSREDRYSGGELIAVYEEYLRLRRIVPGSLDDNANNHALLMHLQKLLLLHNAEDLANLPAVCGVLAYESLFDGDFSFLSAKTIEISGRDKNRQVLNLRFRLSYALPAPLFLENPFYTLSLSEVQESGNASGEKSEKAHGDASGKSPEKAHGDATEEKSGETPAEPPADALLFELAVSLHEGELKYFFADYKNYYYLKVEDYAVHKSVGEFVDARVRRQATAKTCYQRRKGIFLPEPEPVFAPVLYEEYRAKPCYAALPAPLDAVSPGQWKEYALSVLKSFR